MTITIYTDGACKGNPGPGGWGVTFAEPVALPSDWLADAMERLGRTA